MRLPGWVPVVVSLGAIGVSLTGFVVMASRGRWFEAFACAVGLALSGFLLGLAGHLTDNGSGTHE